METQQAIYGIIGNPLKHSLSPVMHNTAFEHLGVNALYKLFPLEEDQLEEFITQLRDEVCPIFGVNVTVPYKAKVIPYLDSLAPLAQRIGAVNTIVVTKQRTLIGYNTDAPGFMTHLVELGFDLTDKRVAVLGAGGSARAILGTLCMIPDRPHSIKVYNRTSSRLNELLADLGERIDLSIVEPVQAIDDLNVELADILINTTSVGLKKSDPCLIDESLMHPGLLVYDLIYNPNETPLLKLAKEHGAKAVNGLPMLFYQGVLAFQHWANIQLDDETKVLMRQALEKGAHA